jgi:hypothetical protein
LKKTVWFIVFAAVSVLLSAQTASEMDRILSAQDITCTQAARFVLEAAKALPKDGDAFKAAQGREWLPAEAKADSPIRLGEVSLLMMKAFALKGGILYSFFPNPRYACRELVYLQIIQGRTDPGEGLDGETFLQILGRLLSHIGEDEQGGIST